MRELQAVIEELAEQLNRAVAIDDPGIRLLAHTAHDEKVDDHRVQSIMTLRAGQDITSYVYGLGIRTARDPVRIPGREDLKMLGRVCVPIRCQGVLLGYLWLIDDDESLSEVELQAAASAAASAGEVLFKSRLLDDHRRSREHQLVLDLAGIGESPEAVVGQETLDAAGLSEDLACRVVVVSAPFAEDSIETEAGDLSLEAVLRRAVRKVPRSRCLVATRRGGCGVVLVAFRRHEDPAERLKAMGREVYDELSTHLPGQPDVVVGIGPMVPDLNSAASSYRRADGVVSICRTVRSHAPVAAWEDLGITASFT